MCSILIGLLELVNWLGNGIDYDSTPISAIFSVGTNTTTINVPVISNDNIIETMESFNLNISIPSTVNNRVILGSVITTVCTIIDDTGKSNFWQLYNNFI